MRSYTIDVQDAIEVIKELLSTPYERPIVYNGDLISRRAVIEALWKIRKEKNQPSAQPEPCEDADKLKRCRFEYINACKTITYPTPDTSKGDIHDAYAVMKALHPIFGDVEF